MLFPHFHGIPDVASWCRGNYRNIPTGLKDRGRVQGHHEEFFDKFGLKSEHADSWGFKVASAILRIVVDLSQIQIWLDTAIPQNGREPRIANKFKAIRNLAGFKEEGLAALTRDAEAMVETTSQIDEIAREILSKLQKPTSEHAESEDHWQRVSMLGFWLDFSKVDPLNEMIEIEKHMVLII